jgi:hypothetical protein
MRKSRKARLRATVLAIMRAHIAEQARASSSPRSGALCAQRRRLPRDFDGVDYDYRPTPRQRRRVCNAIRWEAVVQGWSGRSRPTSPDLLASFGQGTNLDRTTKGR